MLDKFRFADGTCPTAAIRLAMQKEMQKNAAVFRIDETLKEGIKNLKEIYKSMSNVKVSSIMFSGSMTVPKWISKHLNDFADMW